MSNCITPSPAIMALNNQNKQQRLFHPIILFHDHRFMRDGDLEHIHIPYKDPHQIEFHKRRIDRMLQDNGRFWADIMVGCTKENPLSPVPSLVSSSPPSPHCSSSLSPPPRNTSRHRQSTFSFPLTANPRINKPTSATAVAAATRTTTRHNLHHHRHHHLNRQQNSRALIGGGGKKRQRNNLPKPVTAILKAWLAEHKKHPYPNEDEKCQLVRQTGLARNQISNWFINARRRILRPMLMEEGDEEEEEEEEEEEDYVKWHPTTESSRSNNNNGGGVSLT